MCFAIFMYSKFFTARPTRSLHVQPTATTQLGSPMTKIPPRLEPGTLWQRIVERSSHALEHHALQPIETEQRVVEDGGVAFLVHMGPTLSRKHAQTKELSAEKGAADRRFDPFLPPDEHLTVDQLSDTHLGVLNKFNVIDNHLLIVTRDFEEQESLLNLQDFRALWTCMAEFEALGFYNSGAAAGSSQSLKHLQMVRLPLWGKGPLLPIEPLTEAEQAIGNVGTLPGLPFHHVCTRLDASLAADPMVAADESLEHYRSMLARVGIRPLESNATSRASAAYNLLVTRRWMLLVPRTREFFGTISINALGFVGSLFVHDPGQLQVVLKHGPLHILREVSGRP